VTQSKRFNLWDLGFDAILAFKWKESVKYTEARLLRFSYDFGVTVIRHETSDAMVLASALMRGIHPPDNIQNGGRPGEASHKRTG
jgi:hypothetical protein